ncbi:DEAD/DEAH box helicase [Pseudomonas veronii]
METIEELRTYLAAATKEETWGRLLYRGAAWALMRVDGQLPPEAPSLGDTIETDLAEHGFAVLRAALNLRDMEGPSSLSSKGFERAANAFESLVRNGARDSASRGFYRTLSAASYHLAGFSAVAYSLFNENDEGLNNSPGEMVVMLLILRDMSRLRNYVRSWLRDDKYGDDALSQGMEQGQVEADDALVIVLNTGICRAIACFEFALQTGDRALTEHAKEILGVSVRLAGNAANVPLWWTSRVCRSLIDDLWENSLHELLPKDSPAGGEEDYPRLRSIFLASLYSRGASEVELWPSQREAATRSIDLTDDLVVSLPTSAGKTRVAEIAALMTLAAGKRVLVVTPLRALSAQTERTFRKTFTPLGFTVSSLYGASGISSGDEDALRTRHIVIATPEKLDFALRNDAHLIDDVGLIVLDEGHMIGPTEREIRYETLVQRLLRRSDASERRIVCLSAILPSGEELDDLTAWIRADAPGDAVRSDWRPTRQRFGTLVWGTDSARLNYSLDNDGPFLADFVSEMAPRGRDRKGFPRDVGDLAIQAAWEFAAQGKRTLIFSTQANWVEGYGKKVVQFVEKGYLPSLIEDPASISRALEVGREWLGESHPAVAALRVGVAIHHGRLPSPFLRELEILLAEGALRVVVASPTLSQGLNLNAAVLLVPYLVRSGELISGEEFANVAGRAGRAFVDTEGLIVHLLFDTHHRRLRNWRRLVDSVKTRTLKSGLIQVVAEIMLRLTRDGVLERADAFEYMVNSRDAWKSPAEWDSPAVNEDAGLEGEEDKIEEEPLSQLVERLDATVFGLVEALDADSNDLPRLLDEALTGSLWSRQIQREEEGTETKHRKVIQARAKLIWRHTNATTRRGHFAMGVGLEAGLAIDAMQQELEDLVDRADRAALPGDVDELVDALAKLAQRLLVIRPFVPDKKNSLPDDWRGLLAKWISGADVDEIGTANMRVIEDAFMYRLVWALEAIRTRRISQGWESEIVAGGGAAALETGVPQLMMSMLVRAGLPSRIAAIAAIEKAQPVFTTPAEMRAWLTSEEVEDLTVEGDWPTKETAALWQRFRANISAKTIQTWAVQEWQRALDLRDGAAAPQAGNYRIEVDENEPTAWLVTPDYQRLVRFKKPIRDVMPSLWMGTLTEGRTVVNAVRVGRRKAVWPKATG